MKSQILICSYWRDAEFLAHALESLRRYAKGFLPTTVCVDGLEVAGFEEFCHRIDPTVRVVRYDGAGFNRALIAMMKADELCPDADVIHLVGSDCLALREFTPDIYCDAEGRPAVLMNSYKLLESVHSGAMPWRDGVKRILGWQPDFEYMRRLPSSFPRSIFAPMRQHVETRFGGSFDWYITRNNQRGDTSEANILGAYAHKLLPESCCWVNIDGPDIKWNGPHPADWPNAIGQLWSHGGLEHPADAVFEYEFRGEQQKATGKTPRQIIAEVLYDGDQSKVDQMGRVAP